VAKFKQEAFASENSSPHDIRAQSLFEFLRKELPSAEPEQVASALHELENLGGP